MIVRKPVWFATSLVLLASLTACGRSPKENVPVGAYFTTTQALAGKAVFEGKCSSCHTVEPSQPAPTSLRGEAFIKRWRSANDLYLKIASTMPSYGLLSLSAEQYENVTAYLMSLNGERAGTKPFAANALRDGDTALRTAMPPSATSAPAGVVAKGYYTASQARRGSGYFEGSCGLCHQATPAPGDDGTSADPFFANVHLDPAGGFVVGNLRMNIHLAGPSFVRKYPSVGALYRRIQNTMPGSYPRSLDRQTYLDITAHLLRANGFPAGPRELAYDPAGNDAMPLVEPGFTTLFDGTDFRHFRFLRGQNCSPPPEGCGSEQPGSTFTIKDRTIANSGMPYGGMYTANKYLNFSLRFDYRFLPSASEDEGLDYNSGYLLFVEQPQIWPRSIEIEGQERYQLAILPLDTKAEFSWDAEAFERARKLLGSWNSVEIVSAEGVVKSYLNGVLLSTVRHGFKKPGHIMFQAEGGPIFWRNIRIRPDDEQQ